MASWKNHRDNELTLAELEAELAERLPERAVMSTFTVTGVGAATSTLHAAGDVAPVADAAEPTQPAIGHASETALAHASDSAQAHASDTAMGATSDPAPADSGATQPVPATAPAESGATQPVPPTGPADSATEPSGDETTAGAATAAEPATTADQVPAATAADQATA